MMQQELGVPLFLLIRFQVENLTRGPLFCFLLQIELHVIHRVSSSTASLSKRRHSATKLLAARTILLWMKMAEQKLIKSNLVVQIQVAAWILPWKDRCLFSRIIFFITTFANVGRGFP